MKIRAMMSNPWATHPAGLPSAAYE